MITHEHQAKADNLYYTLREYVDHLGVEHIEALPTEGVPIPIAYATHPKRAAQWAITPGTGISPVDHPAATVTTPIAARQWVLLLADLAARGGRVEDAARWERAQTAEAEAEYNARVELHGDRVH